MSDFIWDELDSEQEIITAEMQNEVPPSLRECVPGDLIWNDSGCVYICTRSYPLISSDTNEMPVHDPAVPLAHLALAFPGLPDFANLLSSDCAFLDSETTGLAHNSMPFMIGVGTFERQGAAEPAHATSAALTPKSDKLPKDKDVAEMPTHFVVRQLFAHHPRQESAVLQCLQALLASRPVCVSFNGHGFDIPLIRSRFAANMHHFPELPLADPFTEQPPLSLDLLPLVRKIWRRRIGSCALSNCEARILGLKRTHADVGGAQIPGIYMQYLHSGKANEISRVFYHNRQDIISMSFLLRSLFCSVELATSASMERLNGEEALSMGITMLREARWFDGERLLVFATRVLGGNEHHAASFRELALYYKRQGRWQEAKATWERWLSATEQESVDPYVELAKYHEWRAKDIRQAEIYTRWAMHVHQSSPPPRRSRQIWEELQHRLRRLERKMRQAHLAST